MAEAPGAAGPAATPNPVMERVAILLDQWLRFAEDSEYRLLVWQLGERESRLADAFVGLEGTDSGLTPDVFLPFELPFEDPERYSSDLQEALSCMVEQDRAELESEGLVPRRVPSTGGVAGFTAALSALVACSPDSLRHLVAVLKPKRISDLEAWTGWCRSWLDTRPPSRVRALLVEDPELPGPSQLAGEGRSSVLVLRPELRHADMVAEVAATTGQAGPGKDFNQRFVGLMRAVEERRPDTVRELSRGALQIVEAQGWPALGVAVQVALASWHIQEADLEQAEQAYAAAGELAAAAVRAGDPTGARLAAHAGIGRGSVLLQAGRFEASAPVCADAAERAEAIDDGFSGIEAWRLAALAWARAGERRAAAAAGARGLALAERMKPEDRALTTLPYLGQLLLDEVLSGEPANDARVRLATLLGADWQAKLS